MKRIIESLILGAFGFAIVLLLLRVVFIFFSVSPDFFLFQLIAGFTDALIAPFNGLMHVIQTGSFVIDFPAFLSALMYVVIGVLVSRVVGGFIEDSPLQIG